MTSNLFETAVGAFEERMALRRKMLRVTGVSFPQHRDDELRDSIIKCYDCESGEICTSWLATAAQDASPPEFCPNRESIQRLKSGEPST